MGIIKFLKTKVPLWTLLFFVLTTVVAAFWGYIQPKNTGETKISLVVTNLEKVNETVLVNAGINKVIIQMNNTTIPWTQIGIPLTEKRALIVLNYTAKLGIKKAVSVQSTGENRYEITVPEYQVIGIALNEKEPYILYDHSGKILSLTTANIDTGKLVAEKLTNEEQNVYLANNKELLNDAAKTYYETLFKSINPDIKLTFKFAGQE